MLFKFRPRLAGKKPYITNFGRQVIAAAKALLETPLMKLYDVKFNESWSQENLSLSEKCGISDCLQIGENVVEATFDVSLPFAQNDFEFRINDTLVYKEYLKPEVNKSISYAPCEGFSPLALYSDQHCEELAYPSLFGG